MIVLVLNSGSSSLKYKLLAMPAEAVEASGRVEGIGGTAGPSSFVRAVSPGREVRDEIPCPDHRTALETIFSELAHPERGCLSGPEEVEAVGHRVVHGRDLFTAPCRVTPETMRRLAELAELAPLHMPTVLACMRTCAERLPGAVQVACFDTSFHQSMPEHAWRYAVPREWHERHGVRRYGFHGISHAHATRAASEMLGIPLARLRAVTAHLGNGASITAFQQGRVLDTSMGFTPLEGLVMGTRAGVLDPAVIPYIMARTGGSADAVLDRLNRESGLAAVSGVGPDMRRILEARARGDRNAELAFRMFVHVLRKYTGAYTFALGGADAFVFTGGIGEHAPEVRAALFENLSGLGFELDPEANAAVSPGRPVCISRPSSRVKILVVPADEELAIARETSRIAAPAA